MHITRCYVCGIVLSYSCITITQINYYTRHCHFMCVYHCYTDTDTLDTIISCSCTTDNGYAIPLNTVISYICITTTRILCTQLFHVLITVLQKFTCINAMIISVLLFHGSLFMLHGYSCILVTWLFSVADIDMILLLLDLSVVDMQCVELNATWI